MEQYKIVFTDDRFGGRYQEYELAQLHEMDILPVIYPEGAFKTDADVIEACKDADAIFLNLLPNFKNETVLRELTRCKVINRYGVGYDNVNVPACTKLGIQVTYVPDYCMYDVSDHALALMLACLRQIPQRDCAIRAGNWNIPSNGLSHRLKGSTLGLIGCGRIARCLARKVSGFELNAILGYDPYIPTDALAAMGIKKVELEELLERSDIVSLHMPVTDETRGIMNARTIGMMKKTAILINTGRGPLIEDEALIDALRNHVIGAAGLDTHCVEPLPKDSPYFQLENVVLTDHAAYGTVEGERELRIKSGRNVAHILQKKPLESIYMVNTVENGRT